jgi:hypothetical protein
MKLHHGSLAPAIVFFGIILFIPVPASAQSGPERSGGGGIVRAPARTFPHPQRELHLSPVTGIGVNAGRLGPSASAIRGNTAGQRTDASGLNGGFGGAPLTFQELLNITPNSGFNWEHVNAINQDLPQKALIDPVTQLEIAQAERLVRTTGGASLGGGAYILGGYPYYVPTASDAEQINPEADRAQAGAQAEPNVRPQIIVLQQASPQQAGTSSAQPAAPATPAAAVGQQLPDRGELTLVLRDGTQVKALAFSHVSGKIVYITPDGGRTMIDAADLDASATVRINQEKGTPLQLPL